MCDSWQLQLSLHLDVGTCHQVWIGCERRGRVHICDAESLQPKTTFSILGRGVGFIVCVQNKVGSKILIHSKRTYC